MCKYIKLNAVMNSYVTVKLSKHVKLEIVSFLGKQANFDFDGSNRSRRRQTHVDHCEASSLLQQLSVNVY